MKVPPNRPAMANEDSDVTLEFQPMGIRAGCREGETIGDCAVRHGIGLKSTCAGKGTCGNCCVQVIRGHVSEPSTTEKSLIAGDDIKHGWRLACHTRPATDCKVNVPQESMQARQRLQVEGTAVPLKPKPPLLAYSLHMSAPKPSDLTADADRLKTALGRVHGVKVKSVDLRVMQRLSDDLRGWKWRCQAVVRGHEVVAVQADGTALLGMAVDIGTTKIAAYLVDLITGRSLAADAVMNPQVAYGEDLINRLDQAIRSPDAAVRLQGDAVAALNDLAGQLCASAGVTPEAVVEILVVANTAMHHLLLGLPVRQLAISPFVAAVTGALEIEAREIGLKLSPGAYLYMMPGIAAFVGADHVAMLLATGAYRSKAAILAIDIGTNTEVSLVRGGAISCVSCASGPVFEGGHIECGMRAGSGAIESVRFADGSMQYSTVDGAPPVGICGSGVIDAIAQLYQAGIVRHDGNLLCDHPLVKTHGDQTAFVLARPERSDAGDIVITQRDIRAIQLGKGAIRAGIEVLLRESGCAQEEIEEVIIAGAFGSYIDIASARAIGMFPDMPNARFRQVGNAAGMGARMSLISKSKRREAIQMARSVKYVNLSDYPDFMRIFTGALNFPTLHSSV